MDGEAGTALIASRHAAEADPLAPQLAAAAGASRRESAHLLPAPGQVTASSATKPADLADASGAPATDPAGAELTWSGAPRTPATDPAGPELTWSGAPRRRLIRRFWLTGRFWIPYVPLDTWLKPLEHIRLPAPRHPADLPPLRSRRARVLLRRLLVPAGIVLAAATAGAAWAFVAWGPVGLGNGPLSVPAAAGAGSGWTDLTGQPVALVLPVINAGHSAAVIDSVSVQIGIHGAAADLIAARAGTFARYPCQAIGPLRSAVIRYGPRRGSLVDSALAGCVRPGLAAIAGLTVPAGTNAMGLNGWPISPTAQPGTHGTALVLEFARPRPQLCWSVVAVAIHYRLGTRHYISTSPLGRTIVCSPGARLTPGGGPPVTRRPVS